jgi:lipopolysaccharide transport system permease protein
MLLVYTIVFSVAFKARWAGVEESKAAFALLLFSGMIIHSFFAECLNRAPSLIVQNSNFVKKVVFPLELLPVVAVFSALLHFLISFSVLCFFCLGLSFPIHKTVILVPIVLLPLIMMVLGLSWFLSALGVYLKDLNQLVGFLTSVSLFLAPVFYATESLPREFQDLLQWNPITLPILGLRNVMIFGRPLDWPSWNLSLGIGVIVLWSGYAFFQKTRRGFADVL